MVVATADRVTTRGDHDRRSFTFETERRAMEVQILFAHWGLVLEHPHEIGADVGRTVLVPV